MEDRAAVERAIAALASELGADAVSADEQEVREYRDPYDYKGSDRYTASALRGSVVKVKRSIRVANEAARAAVDFGQGRNNATQRRVGAARGKSLLSMREMNRVLEIDDELAYAAIRATPVYSSRPLQLRRVPVIGWGS